MSRPAPRRGREEVLPVRNRTKGGEVRRGRARDPGPGDPADGVTIHVPLFALPRLSPADLDWVVPGVRAGYVDALARALTKDVRRAMSPIADHVDAFLLAANTVGAPIREAFAEYVNLALPELRTIVEPGDFASDRIPAHLRLHFAILDTNGALLATGDDFERLVGSLDSVLRTRIAELVRRSGAITEVSALTDWSVGNIPRVIEVAAGDGLTVKGYPALVDESSGVALRLFTSRSAQGRAMRSGILRLLSTSVNVARKPLERLFDNEARLALARQKLGTVDELVDDAVLAATAKVAMQPGIDNIWDHEAFDALRERVRAETFDVAATLLRDVASIVVAAATTRITIEKLHSPAFDAAATDIELQLRRLLPRGFVATHGASRVGDIARYVHGTQMRAAKLAGEVERDRARMAPIVRLQAEIDDVLAGAPATVRADLEELRWLTEELRLSQFAPTIRTSGQVSEKRIRRRLDEIAPPIQ